MNKVSLEIRQKIIKIVTEGRDSYDFGPNTTLPSIALVDKCFRDLAQTELYSRVYVGPITFERPLVRTMELLARTLTTNASLASLVVEIHAGTIAGVLEEVVHLEMCIVRSPNLRLFELRGWPAPAPPPPPPPPPPLFWEPRPALRFPRDIARDDGAHNDKGSLDDIFLRLLEKTSLRTLILAPERLLRWLSNRLCGLQTFIAFINHFTNLESVVLHHGVIGRGQRHLGLSTEALKMAGANMYRVRPSGSSLDAGHSMPDPPMLAEGEDITFPTGCTNLKRIYLSDSFSSDSDFRLLSGVAPNISEFSAQAYENLFRMEQSPSISIVPALRVWTPHLVKLILPDYDEWLRRYKGPYPWPGSEQPDYSEDSAIADVITQMPKLRVLGISRGLIAPHHFRRGPNTLISLNYHMPQRYLDAFASILEDSGCLARLRRLCLSVGDADMMYDPQPLIGAVLNARGIRLHKTGTEWETLTDKWDVREYVRCLL